MSHPRQRCLAALFHCTSASVVVMFVATLLKANLFQSSQGFTVRTVIRARTHLSVRTLQSAVFFSTVAKNICSDADSVVVLPLEHFVPWNVHLRNVPEILAGMSCDTFEAGITYKTRTHHAGFRDMLVAGWYDIETCEPQTWTSRDASGRKLASSKNEDHTVFCLLMGPEKSEKTTYGN